MLNNDPLVRTLSVLDKRATEWLRCNRWVRLIDTDKNLGTALVESQWIEGSRSDLVEQDDPSHHRG